MIEAKQVHFRLLEKTKQRDENGQEVEVTWGRHVISARYKTRDDRGVATDKVIHASKAWDEKKQKEVPVEVDMVQFLQGQMFLLEGKDQHIIDSLREDVRNVNFKNRMSTDSAIFEEVDFDAERLQEVRDQDLIFDAYRAIIEAEPETLIEYAKALGVSTAGLDTKKKLTKTTKEYKALENEMKIFAKREPVVFVKNFTNPFRPFLATITDGMQQNVLTYDYNQRMYMWVQGTNRTPIVQVPNGIQDHKEWFAAWLHGNEPTFAELKSRAEAAKKM